MSYPDFIIAGERRSGSTTLYEILKRHSQISMYPKSDMDFFIESELFSIKPKQVSQPWESNVNIEDYKQMFDNSDGKLSAQKDADLLWWKPSHQRLATYLKDTKFVFVLRNPTKRAESQYWNELRKGRETRSFEQAISEPLTFHTNDWEKLHLNYKERGCYKESLEHFFSYIPRSRCHIVILEQLMNNWEVEMSEIANFLNINLEEAKRLFPVHSNKEDYYVVHPKFKGRRTEKLISIYDRVISALARRLIKNNMRRKKLQNYFTRLGKISARKAYPVDKSVLDQLNTFYKPYNKSLEIYLNKEIKEWY